MSAEDLLLYIKGEEQVDFDIGLFQEVPRGRSCISLKGWKVYSADDVEDDVHGKVAILLREVKELEVLNIFLEKAMASGRFGHPLERCLDGGAERVLPPHGPPAGQVLQVHEWAAERIGLRHRDSGHGRKHCGLQDDERNTFADGEDERRDAMRQYFDMRGMQTCRNEHDPSTHTN